MLKRLQDARKADSGFTLIELLIVIVVLGILAGIVVFGVGTFRGDSQEAACKADVKTVAVASDAWNAKNNTIPSVAQLVASKYLKSTPSTSGLAIDASGVVSATCGSTTYTQ